MQKEKTGLLSNAKAAFVVLIAGLLLSLGIACTQAPEKAYAAETDKYVAEITVKNYGTITVELDRSAAPITVDNFVKLARQGTYTNTIFHRVVSGFMIQGGGFKTNGSSVAANNIKGEFYLNGVWNPISHKRGVISMARSTSYNSASSQFFIMHQDNVGLDYQYAAFGHVTKGMDVVDKIAAAEVHSEAGSIDNVPSTPNNQIVIESVKIIQQPGTWKKSNGKWWYKYSDGTYAKGLTTISGAKFFFDSNGYMKTGWQHVTGNSDWYYFNSNGVMKTGWVKSGNKWYYMNSEGIMQKSKITLSGKTYFLNSSGVMQTGWVKDSGNWYYTNGSGIMQTGWKKIGGKWYYLNSNGVMQTGWQTIGNSKYYFNGSGVMQTGWKKISGKYYYFNNSGAMQKSKWIGNYYLGSDGVMATNSWVDGGKYYVDGNGKWVKGKKPTTTSTSANVPTVSSSGTVTYSIASGNNIYHLYDNCSGVKNMKESNKRTTTLANAQSMGLTLCGTCQKMGQ